MSPLWRIAALSAALLAPAVVQAQDFEREIDLKSGAVLELSVTRVKESSRKPTETMDMTYRQTLTVNDEGYRVTQVLLAPAPASLPPEMSLPLGHGVAYQADPALTPQRVDDWEKILETAFSNFKDPESQAAVAKVRDMFSRYSPEQGAQLLLEGQSLMALPQNTSLTLGEAQTYEDEMALPFGPQVVKVKGSILLVSIDKGAGTAKVTWSETLDPASLSKAMSALMEGMVEPAQKQQLAGMTFDRSNVCDYVMDLKTGLTREAECSSTVKVVQGAENGTKIDRWSMRQKVIKP